VGLVPGVSPAIAAFLSYDVERKMSRTPQAFGSGAIEGVAGPEAANNSAVGGNLVPLLTLGIPTSPALAVLLGAFMIHGIRPGPTLFSEHADVAWALIASMYIGNVMLLILNLPLAGIWARLARVPYGILAPIVLVFSLLGVYANRNSVFDVWVALAMGLVGWIMRRADFPVVPLVLGLILFPITETSFRQALALEHGSPLVLLTSPIALAFFGLAIVSLVTSVRLSQRGAIVAAAAEE
jgi:putative tricarboxylic transport membrane protein